MDASFVRLRNRKQLRHKRLRHDRLSSNERKRSLHTETLEPRQLLAADLMISEFMASNSDTLRTDDREYHDWIEIHNPNDEAVSLDGWYLTDDSSDLNKWQFPSVELPAGGFRVVHASDLDTYIVDEDEIHTNFRLASEGDYLAIVRPDNSVAQAYSPRYPDQRTNVSYGYLFDANGIQLGDNYYFETPTPGEPNRTSTIQSIVQQVDIDVPRGYYDEPFDVNLSVGTPNATIKYTTDGTWPTADNGMVATGPVTISTTTTLRVGAFADNMLPSDTNTNTYIFLNDVFKQTGEGLPEEWGYFDDQGPRRPARVKANYGTDPDIVEHEDYKDTLRDDMRAVPTVSLVVDPADLWDFENGLYTNTMNKGDNWERQVSAEWMNVDGETEWATNAGIRIHGGWARRPSQTLKHSFKVIFRGEYGDSNLRYPVFGEDGQQDFQTIIMRGGFNDSWRSTGNSNNTYMQDQWTRATQIEMGGYSSKDQYVHLYLNGLYWGMYSPTERMNAEWASHYMGGEPEEWDVINTGGNVIDGSTREWSAYMRLVNNRNTTYEELDAAMDIEGYVDYAILNQYVGNWDWPHNNWYASRRRVEGEKWRFHSWDAEAAFQRPAEDRVHDVRNEVGPGQVMLALVKHPEFQELYANKVYEHLFNDGALTPEAGIERLRSIAEGMDRAIVGESLRWGDGKDDSGRPLTRENWTRRIESLVRTYFPRRGDQLIEQLRRVATPLVAPLYADLDAPSYNQYGGQVTPDFDINITTDIVGATVFYTTDGTDPRGPDNSVSESAIRLTSEQLVDASSAAKILVPTGAANENNWQAADYNDSQWSDGAATVGYESGTLDDPLAVLDGFTVTQYDFADRPESLADIDGWLAAGTFDAEKTINVPYLNFLDGRRGGNFSDSDLDFPNAGNNYGTRSTGTISIKDAGEYTFIITSNDAARLTIDGNVVHADEGRHGTEDAFVTMTLTAGDHPVEIMHFDRSGTGVLEFGFSHGTKTEFDDTFQLVGNSSHRDFTDIIQTDLKDQLLGKSSTAYLRIPFNVDNPGNVGNLLLRPQYGDGFAAYLNGTLVASANVPDDLTHESTAVDNRFDSLAVAGELFDISEHKSLLKAGENILAVQALNNAADDLDMLFSPDLFMTLEEAPINITESTNIRARVNLNDQWSALTNAQFSISDPATSANLRVSEINYHPSSSTESEIAAGFEDADDFEFIELVNISDKAVDLSNVSLTQIVVGNNNEGVKFNFADGAIHELRPGEHVLVVEDIAAFRMRYGDGLPVAGQWNGALSNDAETISVLAGDSVVQRFAYQDSWRPLSDGGGSTLEVYSPAGRAGGDWDNAATWRASIAGGTPGTAGAVMAGDSNGDGIFDSSDLLLVFQAGEYEDAVAGNSTFAEGDWDGDGDFTSSDIVAAFMQGNYDGGVLEPQPMAVAAATDFDSVFAEREDTEKKESRLDREELHDSILQAWM